MDVDLPAYLARIGWVGSQPRADLATLAALQRAHATTIPFENLDIHLGRGIPLGVREIAAKLVGQRRGGYCFEHNALFAAVLEAVGFCVTRLCGRVSMGRPLDAPPPPRTHMVLAVEVEGAAWLVDVGFGAHQPIAPIALVDGVRVQQDAWSFELVRSGEVYTLRTRQPDRWIDLYAFTREPQFAIDFEVANHYTSTHPASRFVQGWSVQRVTPAVRAVLRGRLYERQTVDAWERRTLADWAEVAEVMARVFGVELGAGVVLPDRAFAT